MALPVELRTIFKMRQKSYKMVLVLALLDEQAEAGKNSVALAKVRERFIGYFRGREAEGKVVDRAPEKLGRGWGFVEEGQIKALMETPLKDLEAVMAVNRQGQTIGFRDGIWLKMDEQAVAELRNYALTELVTYYEQMAPDVSLKTLLGQVMAQYVQARREPFEQHPLGQLLRLTIPNEIKKLSFIDEHCIVVGSIGKGQWTNVPWIAIMDNRNTRNIQRGEYVVYLFSEDMSAVYLTLNQGVTIPLRELKKEAYPYLQRKVQEMRALLPLDGMRKDDNVILTEKGIGRNYQASTIAYIRYDRDHLPNDEQLVADLENVMENYRTYVESVVDEVAVGVAERAADEVVDDGNVQEADDRFADDEYISLDERSVAEKVAEIKVYIQQRGFQFPEGLVETFYLSLRVKPFVILAGISGTGKTKLVQLFAEAIGATRDNGQFTLIPVRPDWNDPTDLFGYVELSGAFRPGRLTEVLVEASLPANRDKPYLVCLDEMNLARVEHYFSDMLSIMETQQWDNGRIVTDPVLRAGAMARLADRMRYDGLRVPDNVYIVGTVNMDETTHPFSKKVLDRANTIEFNEIDLRLLPEAEGLAVAIGEYGQTANAFLRSDYLQLMDAVTEHRELIERTTERLVEINLVLEHIHAQVGFRVRDAVCFYMIYNKRFGLMTESEAFDGQVLQKILPRVQGSSMAVKRALLELMGVALGQSMAVEALLDDASELEIPWRPGATPPAAALPQSARKIASMLRRLEEDGFTSFWLC